MYLIVKSIHIISVMSWFAGLVYLGRILIYHREAILKNKSKDLCDTFELMEKRAWRIICNPAMLLSLLSGLYLIHKIGAFSQGWFHAKFSLIILLLGYHIHTMIYRKRIIENTNKSPSILFLKIYNEILTAFIVLIVFLVITKSVLQAFIALIIIFGLIGGLMMGIKVAKRFLV